MICSYCDAEMPDISAFCPACGQAVRVRWHRSREDAEAKLANWQGALLATVAYFTAVPALLFLAIPRMRRDNFVRFHCWQSLFFFIATVLAALILRLVFTIVSLLPGVGFLLACLLVGVVLIAFVVLWMVVVLKAALGQIYRLPWLGVQAARLVQ